MDNRLLILYFVAGGATVAAASYFGSRGQGLLAAIVSMVPAVTLITLCSIYFAGGPDPAVSYFKGLLVVLPAWLLYVGSQILLIPRLGLGPAIAIGLALYLGGSWTISRFVHWS